MTAVNSTKSPLFASGSWTSAAPGEACSQPRYATLRLAIGAWQSESLFLLRTQTPRENSSRRSQRRKKNYTDRLHIGQLRRVLSNCAGFPIPLKPIKSAVGLLMPSSLPVAFQLHSFFQRHRCLELFSLQRHAMDGVLQAVQAVTASPRIAPSLPQHESTVTQPVHGAPVTQSQQTLQYQSTPPRHATMQSCVRLITKFSHGPLDCGTRP